MCRRVAAARAQWWLARGHEGARDAQPCFARERLHVDGFVVRVGVAAERDQSQSRPVRPQRAEAVRYPTISDSMDEPDPSSHPPRIGRRAAARGGFAEPHPFSRGHDQPRVARDGKDARRPTS